MSASFDLAARQRFDSYTRLQPTNAGAEAANAAAAQQFWKSDPVGAFEQLRDRISTGLYIACELYQKAVAAPPKALLFDIGRDFYEPILIAVLDAQALWFDTPISRYLDRMEGPVHFNPSDGQAVGRASGSCHHDLALMVLATTVRCMREPCQVGDYVSSLRVTSAVGDRAP